MDEETNGQDNPHDKSSYDSAVRPWLGQSTPFQRKGVADQGSRKDDEA